MAAMDIPLALDAVAAQEPTPTSAAPKTIPKTQPKPIPISPGRTPYANVAATSPALFRSSSPRLHSPASSEIFERSVQEPIPISTLEGEPRAHLATHVITEDHIPPALEASAQAITSQELDPDEVEIVTSTAHQTVLESSTSQLDLTSLNSARGEDAESISQSGFLGHHDEESGSTYGSIDPNDVRRLSFISFADVVQSEHQHPVMASGDANHSPSLSGSLPNVRARSPFRSPQASQVSSSGLSTPPMSAVRQVISADQSPVRNLNQPVTHGGLTIETMRQAVRKTASGDIGQNFRSPAMSPISSNDELTGLRSRTNS